MDARIHNEIESAEAVGDVASLKKFNLIMSIVGTEVAGKLPEIAQRLKSAYTELLESTSNGGQKVFPSQIRIFLNFWELRKK